MWPNQYISNVVLNKDFPNIVTDNLSLHLDPSNISSFVDSQPIVNLLYRAGAYNLINGAGDIYGNCTKTDLGGGKFRFVNNGNGGSTIRVYTNQADLIAGATYTCSVYFENLYGSLSIDWCDVGITGTNGKTTSAYMAFQLQESFYTFDANAVSIYVGTLGFNYGYSNIENGDYSYRNFDNSISKNTTPDLFEIFEILEKISNSSDIFEYTNPANISINIEVSSHALSQGRLKYIPFSKAALMNIGSDHIDYHKSIYEYEKCKFKIFDLVHSLGEKYIGIDNINIKSKALKKYSITGNKLSPQVITAKYLL